MIIEYLVSNKYMRGIGWKTFFLREIVREFTNNGIPHVSLTIRFKCVTILLGSEHKTRCLITRWSFRGSLYVSFWIHHPINCWGDTFWRGIHMVLDPNDLLIINRESKDSYRGQSLGLFVHCLLDVNITGQGQKKSCRIPKVKTPRVHSVSQWRSQCISWDGYTLEAFMLSKRKGSC